MTKESDIALLKDSGADVTFLGNMVEIHGFLTLEQIEAVQRLLRDGKNYELAPISGKSPDEPKAPRDQYKEMFHAAVASIAEISEALGISEEEASVANGNEEILEAIHSLQPQLWAAWSDSFGFLDNAIGVHPQRALIESRIAKSLESPQAVKDLRPVPVAVHLDRAAENRAADK